MSGGPRVESAVAIARLDTSAGDFDRQLQARLQWSDATDAAIESRVSEIIADVRARGDAAVLECTARFDGLDVRTLAELEIGRDELEASLDAITPAQRSALETAAARIRAFHERQLEAAARGFSYRDADGSLLGQKVTPLARVGIYVPGGKAAYPSSVLMNGVPASVAGVGEVVMVAPMPSGRGGGSSAARGERNPLVLAAASLAGVHRLFTIGGAQAIAALAYGTATIPRVDKITGPGNAYVAAAKRRVFGQVGIDMIAGPSEILVLADGSTPADWVAMDLFSQAEHDELAQSILLSPDAAYLDAVQAAIERLLPEMPRQGVIRASLEGRGALIRTRSMDEACAIANRIAPEHLEIASREPHRWEPMLVHAGAIFLGACTSESLGDYCAGPNHVLPTSGTARFSSPLGVYDFVKRTSLIEVSAGGAAALGPVAAELAYGEGLQAHARAAQMRLQTPGRIAEGDAASIAPATDAAAAAAASSSASNGSPAGFCVRPVTEANVDQLIKLKVAPDQEQFVAGVAVSLAQAAYRPLGRPMALYDGDVPVGLVLLWDSRRDPDDPGDELYVWRLMVDAAHQRKGYGTQAIRWVIDEARRLGVAQVGLSHQPGEGNAGPFYAKLGFAYTGKVEHGEHEMVLPLRPQP